MASVFGIFFKNFFLLCVGVFSFSCQGNPHLEAGANISLDLGARKPSSYSSPGSPRTRTSSLWSNPETPHAVQLENAIELMQETVFQDVNALQVMGLSSRKYGGVTERQGAFFKRLLLFMGLAGLRYRSEDGQHYKPWPFPLATALTQGQRVFIELRGVSSRDFLSWMTGGHLHLLQRRKYSSHGVRKEGGVFKEKKFRGPLRRIKRYEKLFGMNFPLGGLGNPLPNGDLVGPYGFEYSVRKKRLSKKKQVGHLHVYTHDFPTQRYATVLMGIEACAPGTSNQFGCNHTAFSGLRNQKLNRSTSGGLKWAKMKDLANPPPAEYKGKFIVLTKEAFEALKKRVYTVMSMPVQEQKRIFSIFLPKNGEDAKRFLSTYDGWMGS